jgi:serine/threonine protein kinase
MQRAVFVTAEVEDAMDLEQFIATGRFYEDGVATARQLLRKLANATRLLHANGFYHRNMKIRNILVLKRAGEIDLLFFDCPSGYRPPRAMLQRGIVRDLVSLARGLRGALRSRDLLYLYKQYRGCSRLGPEDKALARDALAYHSDRRITRKRRRWEAKKSRQRALERQSALVAADSHER